MTTTTMGDKVAGILVSGSGKKPIEWGVRFKIAHGVAEGLRYLHEGCHRRIIHRDIKASNILLTEDYRPQVGLILPAKIL